MNSTRDINERDNLSHMQQRDLISVIVPIYKVETYLINCIKSILTQTYEKLEILLIDDGSPDKCGKICDDFAIKDKRVKVCHRKNGGLSAARNTGIDMASGKYLLFVDSDDYIHSRMIEILYNVLKSEKVKVSIAQFYRVKSNILKDKEVQKIKAVIMSGSDFLYKTRYWSACGRLFDKKLFERNRFVEGQTYEDFYLITRIIAPLKKVAVIENPSLYYYVFRPTSIMVNSETFVKRDLFEILNDNLKYFKKSNLSILAKEKLICAHFFEGMSVIMKSEILEKGSMKIFRKCIMLNVFKISGSCFLSQYSKVALFLTLIFGSKMKNILSWQKLISEEAMLKSKNT